MPAAYQPLNNRQIEFLVFFREYGAGMHPARLARMFKITRPTIDRWEKNHEFRRQMIAARATWPPEEVDPELPYTGQHERWICAFEDTMSREAACERAKLPWPRVELAIEKNPAFRRAVMWVQSQMVDFVEDAYLQQALENPRVAKHILESNREKYIPQSKVRGRIEHGHTHSIGQIADDDWLRERLAASPTPTGETIDVEFEEVPS